nr:hypothetical protein [Escherichia coli]
MAELVIAPFLEPVEDRVVAPLRVLRQVPEDGDIARIADFFGQIRGVKDEFRAEIGVFFRLGEEAEVHPDARILQRIVDETGMFSRSG